MAITKLHIEQFLELAKENVVLDVRSPAEYEHAHIPGSFSLPLFSNEERAIVGTTYKQESREQAIKTSLDYFGPKMRKMVEMAEKIYKGSCKENSNPVSHPSKIVLTYCWRGGMRSAGVGWLLDLYGFKVYTLAGGYKSFRKYVLESFRKTYPFRILGGFTGSGKTEVLKQLKQKGERVIDLEEIACHKGSAFGNIGMPIQPGQEMFENLLAKELMALTPGNGESPFIWMEDESQRIGLVNIPTDLWKAMRAAPVFFLDIPFEERLKHITEEYGRLDRNKMADAIQRISSRLGGLETKNATTLLLEGNIPESFRILLKYYDKWYLKGLHNRDGLNSLLHTVSCNSVTPLNGEKLTDYFQYHEKH